MGDEVDEQFEKTVVEYFKELDKIVEEVTSETVTDIFEL